MLKNGVNYFTEELILTVPQQELFDEETNTFFELKEQSIRLKHSLISISKWEAKYKKQFLSTSYEKTYAETIDYIRFMTITQNVDPTVYQRITNAQIGLVNDYISETMSGTTFGEEKKPPTRFMKPVSAEEIYYWMTEYNIPPEYAKWHLSKLMTLIKVCGVKKTPPKKGKKNRGADYRAINNARRAKHKTRG